MLAFCFLWAFGFLIGFLIGKGLTLKQELDTSNPSNDTALDPTKTYWKIVRYRKGTKDLTASGKNSYTTNELPIRCVQN